MFDVLIIGTGLSGAIAAAVLARTGLAVAVVDRIAAPPFSFRAEQLVGPQVDMLRELGVLGGIVGNAPAITHAIGARGQRIVGGIDAVHYGLHYQTMVCRARKLLPQSVACYFDRVTGLQNGPDRQSVTLGSGRRIEARLVVLATGQERALVQHLGIGRRIIRAAHSLTIGFDIAPPPGEAFRIPLLTCYPSDIRHRIDYLAVFPVGRTTRVNLFTYCTPQDAWIQAFRETPREALLAGFPGLERILGPLSVSGAVQMRVNDLWMVTGEARDGLVLIGDAYQTSCPATGRGISRLLLDIERLCRHHLPAWLAEGDVTAAAITRFYDDPVKLEFANDAADSAEYQRSVATETGWRWRMRRRQVALRQWLGGRFGGPLGLTTGFTCARIPPPRAAADPAEDEVSASLGDEPQHHGYPLPAHNN